jgi:hypothetical protein
MRCYLEIDTPKSCKVCDLRYEDHTQYFCAKLKVCIDVYHHRRHPDCPLAIEEGWNRVG